MQTTIKLHVSLYSSVFEAILTLEQNRPNLVPFRNKLRTKIYKKNSKYWNFFYIFAS